MNEPLICIDKNYLAVDDKNVTANLIDAYIASNSLNMLDVPKREEHVLEMVTHNLGYWERIVNGADELLWLNNEGRGVALYHPGEGSGYTRAYCYMPAPKKGLKRYEPWSFGDWKGICSEIDLFNILNKSENKIIFERWKEHQLKINKIPTEFADGRIQNTIVDKAFIVTKGNGCAVCGDVAQHFAQTTLSEARAVMLSISLCEKHQQEAEDHPCVLSFFGTLFYLKIEVPDLVKLDHIPDELIEPIADIIASYLSALFERPEKRKNGWRVKFIMDDGWSWLLRLNSLTDYAYMLSNRSGKQLHRIDSANHHPEVPFGPDHQHFYPKSRKEAIEPSFTYGIPLFDFPLLQRSRLQYQ